MDKQRVSEPRDRIEFLTSIVERVDRIGLDGDNAVGKLRTALAEIENGGPGDDADLITNPAARRDRIREGLASGKLTLAKARAELIELEARIAADAELAKMLTDVASARRSGAWRMALAIDWERLLQPIGREAADRVNELAPALPGDPTERIIADSDETTRATWEEFRSALGRYRGVTGLLGDMRWNKLLPTTPLTDQEFASIGPDEWSYAGRYGALASEQRNLTAQIHRGAVAGVPTPRDIERRMESRADLAEAAVGVRQLGWPCPGVDVAMDYPDLPGHVRAQLPHLVKREAA